MKDCIHKTYDQPTVYAKHKYFSMNFVSQDVCIDLEFKGVGYKHHYNDLVSGVQCAMIENQSLITWVSLCRYYGLKCCITSSLSVLHTAHTHRNTHFVSSVYLCNPLDHQVYFWHLTGEIAGGLWLSIIEKILLQLWPYCCGSSTQYEHCLEQWVLLYQLVSVPLALLLASAAGICLQNKPSARNWA